jgi:hypothetical protein
MAIYDPEGPGAASSDPLVRRGRSWESAKRLAAKCAEAEEAGFPHGVSVTSPDANRELAKDPEDCVTAARSAFETDGFEVIYTPTRRDPDHHTVELPKPVTEEIAVKFNTILGRARKE